MKRKKSKLDSFLNFSFDKSNKIFGGTGGIDIDRPKTKPPRETA